MSMTHDYIMVLDRGRTLEEMSAMEGVDCDNLMLQDVVSCTKSTPPPHYILGRNWFRETRQGGWPRMYIPVEEAGSEECAIVPVRLVRCGGATGTSVDIGLCPWSLVSVFILS